jgi:nitric oxide reductase NorD protein
MRRLWQRWRARWAPVVELESVRRRLGFVLQAMYDRPFIIAVRPLASALGDTIYLPPTLDARGGRAPAEARYRLLGFEQAERVMRGTATHAPADLLERDLYWLSEAAAVDASLARAMPGTRALLSAGRAAALKQRPNPRRLTPLEYDVEMRVRRVLGTDVMALDARPTASDSAEWARETARRLRHRHGTHRPYRAVQPVQLWGAKAGPVERHVPEQQMHAMPDQVRLPIRSTRPEVGGDASGLTPVPKPQAGPTEEHPEGAAVQSDTAGEAGVAAPSREEGDLRYPEWDARSEQYRPNAVLVRQRRAEESDAMWSEQDAPLVRRVRQRFELLKARRTRLRQQKDGDELDLAACVRALVDVRTGGPADDRLYAAVRPARRPIAIALLADVSGSTEAQVTATQQVIDVERMALLLASEALDALGDPYTMLTFAGHGIHNVRVTTIKDFGESSGEVVRRRVGAMRPNGNTRMGAAVRHATALLLRQPAGHRLLLILSDGRPSDQDGYHEEYGIEDTRQAILEARARDVFPFCLTVDREGADYLPHIFGASGHTILRHADQLPMALLTVVRQLLAS